MSSKDFIWEEVEPLQQVTKGGTIQDMEDALAAKTQAVEELSRELEDIRAAFGTEGVQQLQDFEAALKQRDGIITQLTANLQQARKEKDEIMKEFLALTEQSQKLQIQFQQLQAGETLRNTSHSSTAADLLQARQQLMQYQQQLEEINIEVKKDENDSHQSDEKDLIMAEQERVISERDGSLAQLEDELESAEKCQQLEKGRVELENCKGELEASRQKERMSSNEIKQLMGTVEDLQKRYHQGSQSESDTVHKMQEESVRKLELLRAELDEMYGQQIVQMKQELNLQHAARVEQMTEQYRIELELLKAQQLSQSSAVSTEVDTLNAKIRELQETVRQSQAMHDKTRLELSQVAQEKLNLQAKVDDLLQDLRSAKAKVEQVSHSLISQESQQGELQRLQETIDNLKSELAAAQEAAEEAEAKHDSEITNYKIKLEMLEREKDAVLDRMAESQEAELERLRTQLLFSHEEELISLREELQRESFLNTENLLNEAAVKHEKALDKLRIGYEEKMQLLQREKASFAAERDELLHQILGLKEDLKLSLHSSKADKLVQQLQELQVEIEELRKGGEERVRMESKIQTLVKTTEVLENQSKEKDKCWESKWKEQELEKEKLIGSNNTLKEELEAKTVQIETLTAENNQKEQKVVELSEEIEKQRNIFSFAEKNFEVNYQELKAEYTCLIEAKTQLEERTLKETLEFEAKIASLQSQIQELEDGSRDIKMADSNTDGEKKAVIEKDTAELMEKLNVTLSEKENLAGRLSEVTEQLMFTESKVGQLEEELVKVRKENAKVIAQNESLGKELEKKQEIRRAQARGQHAQRKLQQEEQAVENILRQANEKLTQALVEVLKTTAAAEETMGLHMQSLSASSGEQQATAPQSTTQRANWQRVNTQPARPAGHSAESFQGSEIGADNVSLWPGETEADEGLEVSQEMMESLLLGAGTQLENEEYLMGISKRLQTALEKMLVALSDTTNQLEHARMTQTELMRESFRHNQEMNELLQKQEELQERLSEEARAREQLALELHRAEGLIDGYTGERAALEEQLRQKDELQLGLEQELQVTSSRLHELEQERHQMQEERELLSRQQDAMKENAGPRELHLLEETEKLMKEKVEVQRQAEKENADLLKQVKLLEAELEEQVNRVIELEHAQRTESGDLQQQVQALEKQLEKNRRFLDEQAVDREHERDFFQQEIQKLEQQLKNPQKLQTGSEQRNQEVDQLTSQLKEKADWCSELLLSSEQLRRELGERDEEIDKLESRIRELEQALLASAESLEKVRKGRGRREARHSTLESQLQTEREALERKEKEICNLEEQLEQFREELENKSEEVQQLNMQLEIQKKEITSQQEYLDTRDSMLQVMEKKDREIALLNEQITKLQHMETASDNKVTQYADELIKDLESQVECLRSEQERLKRNNEEELDQLNAVIDKLQQELSNIEQKQPTEEDDDTKDEQSQEEYDEMKQRMDQATKELDILKTEHSKLLETYLRLKESAEALAQSENVEGSEAELEEALREKTAGLVVMQAQVQALEQSATSRVEELDLRIRELEDVVDEKNSELRRCRLLLEQTQSNAEGLQQKVSDLEKNLTEKVAAVLVSQATLEAFQQQQSQGSKENQQEQRRPNEPHVYDFDLYIQYLTTCLFILKVKTEEERANMADLLQEVRSEAASTKEELDSFRQHNEKLQEDLQVREVSISELKGELQEVRQNVDTTKEELNSYRQHNEKLQEELCVRELSISKLKEELQEVRTALMKTADSSPPSPSEQQHTAVTHSFTQTEPLQMSDLAPDSKSPTKDEVEEVIGEFQDKIVQMQELHAAEILDMEARHISESESLRRDTQALEDECKALKAVIDKLRSTEVRPGYNNCIPDPADILTHSYSSDYSQRTGFDLPSLQQEFRTTPEGARRETDDPLPDRIKTLLREVHQEGMQVLSLSELPISEGEPSSQFNIPGWVKERDALLATVESLKGLITQMQTHRETQTDWRAELLDAVRQVFMRERSVLKSALYSHLDLLDTSDAVIHLNQLERRLSEQHREAMGSLCTADRTSLISEIHQLRGQLDVMCSLLLLILLCCLLGFQPAVLSGAECSSKEQREGGGSDGAAEADRLLVEELKVELSQTKLELETTLKAQHKHLKELDTLRVEVSQKAAVVDTLNDQLTEERKRSRDLQWAVEKEKCRTGRNEESKREELEDLHLSLEEHKSRVAQLTLTLDQERQASSKLSQHVEQEHLSLQRSLQELQVQLETERAKALEMSTALGRERELRTAVSSDGGPSNEVQDDGRSQEEEGSLLERLQRELDDKHAQVCAFVLGCNRVTLKETPSVSNSLYLFSRRGVSKADSSGMLLSQEREAWTREKIRLEKALHLAQAQVARLRGEIRSDTLREITGPEADNAALKRIYGKYLRSESFRKALIYQKKYLLLLLGGFQECEEATLMLLSRMGGRPSPSSLESLSQRRRGLMRFRSAVRVSIALSRMRFLVKRWHKATGMSSTTSPSVHKNGAGQTLGTEARDSPYLHPGSVEMYRERGGGGVGGGGVSSSRGRSGRESPRSAVSSTQHRYHGALTCSHLQNYDPDRALTDYISRLEALQRRLGSVTSGNVLCTRCRVTIYAPSD
uniref:A-kinase anchoring protein 9 n=1 Tax=Sparus aurata TaxID=8175 RepID=A0A671VW75_SPAAU